MNAQSYWEPTFSEYFFSFRGRIGRFELFMYQLLLSLFGALCIAITMGVGFLIVGDVGAAIGYVIGAIIIVWPSLALAVKRCHDRNRSGAFVLVSLIPVISLWYLIEMLFIKGSEGENKYGLPSFEASCKIFEPLCPVCGTVYNFIDRVTQPSMCKTCWKANKAI